MFQLSFLHSFRFWPLVTVLLFVFILWIIVVSDAGTPNVFIDEVKNIPYGDKVGHMGLYGLLALLVSLSLKPRQQRYLSLPLGCALVLLFSLVEELTQYFFPATRTLDIGDVVADFLGIYSAAKVYARISERSIAKNLLSVN